MTPPRIRALSSDVKRLMQETYPACERHGAKVIDYRTTLDHRRVVAVKIRDKRGLWSWLIHDEPETFRVPTHTLAGMYGITGRVGRLPADATTADVLRVVSGLMEYAPPTRWGEYGRWTPGPKWRKRA